MPSSGTAAITAGRDVIIADAFRKMRVLAVGQTLDSTTISDSLPRLNFILANLSSRGLPLWTYQTLQIPQVAGQLSYKIGPSGVVDVVAERPLRIFDGCFIRDSSTGTDVDTPLRIISRQEYLMYGSKSVTGIPNSIYYDSGIVDPSDPLLTSPSTGYGTLYAYTPLQSGVARTIFANVQRPIFSMTDGSGPIALQEFDLPQEWYLYLVYALAADLADDYEVPEDRILRLEKRRDEIRESLMDWSVETASTSFAPMAPMGR